METHSVASNIKMCFHDAVARDLQRCRHGCRPCFDIFQSSKKVKVGSGNELERMSDVTDDIETGGDGSCGTRNNSTMGLSEKQTV
jgi:hypothetical protein